MLAVGSNEHESTTNVRKDVDKVLQFYNKF